MTANADINYDSNRNTSLINSTNNGYNYVGWTKNSTSDLSTLNSTVGLTYSTNYSETVAFWNESSYLWNYWFSGFGFNTNHSVPYRKVLLFKIESTKYLDIGEY